MSKLRLVTVLSLGALALGAITATSATAQWMVNGVTLAGTETKALASGAAVDEVVKLSVPGQVITCAGKNLEFGSPQIEAGDKGSTNSLIFTECTANEKCTVNKTIGTLPLVTTATLDGTLAANFTLTPKTGTVFATLKFEGGECALLGTQTLTGKAKFLAPTGRDERLLQLIEAKTTAASGELKMGSSSVELKGSALQKLATDLPWSFL